MSKRFRTNRATSCLSIDAISPWPFDCQLERSYCHSWSSNKGRNWDRLRQEAILPSGGSGCSSDGKMEKSYQEVSKFTTIGPYFTLWLTCIINIDNRYHWKNLWLQTTTNSMAWQNRTNYRIKIFPSPLPLVMASLHWTSLILLAHPLHHQPLK